MPAAAPALRRPTAWHLRMGTRRAKVEPGPAGRRAGAGSCTQTGCASVAQLSSARGAASPVSEPCPHGMSSGRSEGILVPCALDLHRQPWALLPARPRHSWVRSCLQQRMELRNSHEARRPEHCSRGTCLYQAAVCGHDRLSTQNDMPDTSVAKPHGGLATLSCTLPWGRWLHERTRTHLPCPFACCWVVGRYRAHAPALVLVLAAAAHPVAAGPHAATGAGVPQPALHATLALPVAIVRHHPHCIGRRLGDLLPLLCRHPSIHSACLYT